MVQRTDSQSALSDEQILRERARVFAVVPEAGEAPESCVDVLEFSLARERYALELRHVGGVHPLKALTPVPGTPPFVLGIVSIRARVVPVYDLKKFFDLPDQGLVDLHQIILLRGPDVEFGLLADFVQGVRRVPLATLQPGLATLTGIRAEYLRGVTPDLVTLLDAGRILADPKLIVNAEAG